MQVVQSNSLNDPNINLWITANAGSGKTTQLINRFLLLLRNGIEPEEIVCITYTEAATTEIKNRILNAATKQHFNIKENQLKIYTIHGLCKILLTINNHLPSTIDVLNDDEVTIEKMVKTILKHLENKMHDVNNEHDIATEQISEIINVLSETETITSYRNIIKNIIKNQLSFLSLFNKIKVNEDLFDKINFDFLYKLLPEDLQNLVDKNSNIRQISLNLQKDLDNSNCDILVELVASILGKKKGKNTKENYSNEFFKKLENWQHVVLTNDNKPRKNAAKCQSMLVQQIQQYFLEKLQQANINTTYAILKLAFIVLKDFKKIKEQKNVVTYDDFLFLTLMAISENNLFKKEIKNNGSNIKHLMLDEAQDTNPISWQIIYKIIDTTKSNFFIVGDEKQSIYRFQGAKIEEYEANKKKFENLSKKLGKPFDCNITLNTSFRSIQPILDEADAICNNELTKTAFTNDPCTIIKHNCYQEGLEKKPKGFILNKAESVINDIIQINEDFNEKVVITVEDGGEWLNRTQELLLKQERKQQDIRNVAEKLYKYIMDNKKDVDNGIIDCNSLANGVAIIYPCGTTKDNFIFDVIAELQNSFNVNVTIGINLEKSSIYYIDIVAVLQFFVLQNDNVNLSLLLKSEIFNFTDKMLMELCTTGDRFTEINPIWKVLKYQHFTEKYEEEKLKFAVEILQKVTQCSNLDEILLLMKEVITEKIKTNNKCKKYLRPLQIIKLFAKQNIEQYNYDIRSFLLALSNNKLKNTTMYEVDCDDSGTQATNKTVMPKVFFSTIHGVKGLEFDTVLFVNLRQNTKKTEKMLFFENFFWYKTSNSNVLLNNERYKNLSIAILQQEEQDENEKLRLKYVAITRAKRKIVYLNQEINIKNNKEI